MISICDFNIGEYIKIKEIKLNDYSRDRIMSLGFTTNSIIKLVRVGFKKHLIVYEVKGAMIALRRDDCKFIYGEII